MDDKVRDVALEFAVTLDKLGIQNWRDIHKIAVYWLKRKWVKGK